MCAHTWDGDTCSVCGAAKPADAGDDADYVTPEMDLEMTPVTTSAHRGDTVDYEVTVKGTGDVSSSPLYVTFVPDAGLSLVKGSVKADGCSVGLVSGDERGLDISLTSFAKAAKVTLSAKVADDAPREAVLTCETDLVAKDAVDAKATSLPVSASITTVPAKMSPMRLPLGDSRLQMTAGPPVNIQISMTPASARNSA